MSIPIRWVKYNNFFELWESHRRDTKLIYVIGDFDYTYIGSIGGNGGQRGLGTRYQGQYLKRAKSIFKLDIPDNQPSYAGCFDIDLEAPTIKDVEIKIQNDYIKVDNRENYLFKRSRREPQIELSHTGDLPPFLNYE